MEVLFLFFFGFFYLGLSLYCGRFLLNCLKLTFKSEILAFILGYLLIEIASLISFICFGFLGYKSFLSAFLPNILIVLTIFIMYIFFRKKYTIKIGHFNSLYIPFFFLFAAILGFYLIGAQEQILSIINSHGIIYQDIIYHGAIVNSLINFGYPINDPQYYNQILNYHFFTHFITGKFSYITGANTILTYHLFLNIIGIFFYSLLSILVSKYILENSRNYFKKHFYLIFSLSFISFFCAFLIGGNLSYGFVFNFFFSASFQWQLCFLLLFYLLTMEIEYSAKYSKRNILVYLFLFFGACMTKISSLPLMITGILSLCIYYIFFYNKVRLKYWCTLGFLYIALGVFIYYFFFSHNSSESSQIGFNLDIVERNPIVLFLKIKESWLLFIILLVSSITYRVALFFKLDSFNTWFSGGILLAGFVLGVLFKADQAYFLFPSIIIASHLSIGILYELKKTKFLILIFLSLIILSFYPIAGLNHNISDTLIKKEKYEIINSDRITLYGWLKNHTNKNEVIFTTSVFGYDKGKADNFYPSAYSERIFYLGGYRFGGLENNLDFEYRQNLVKCFKIDDESIRNALNEADIKYVLIESKGNFNNRLFENVENFDLNQFYKTMYKNSHGIILKIR